MIRLVFLLGLVVAGALIATRLWLIANPLDEDGEPSFTRTLVVATVNVGIYLLATSAVVLLLLGAILVGRSMFEMFT